MYFHTGAAPQLLSTNHLKCVEARKYISTNWRSCISDLFLICKIEACVQMSMATRRLSPKFLFSRFCVPRPIASLLLRFPDNTDPRKTRRNKHVSCSFTLWSENANYKYKHHANTLSPTKHTKTKMCFLFSLW